MPEPRKTKKFTLPGVYPWSGRSREFDVPDIGEISSWADLAERFGGKIPPFRAFEGIKGIRGKAPKAEEGQTFEEFMAEREGNEFLQIYRGYLRDLMTKGLSKEAAKEAFDEAKDWLERDEDVKQIAYYQEAIDWAGAFEKEMGESQKRFQKFAQEAEGLAQGREGMRARNLASQLGMGEGVTEAQKARQAQEKQYEDAEAWEEWRREQAGILSQNPRNWIEVWKFQHRPNPLAPRYLRGFQPAGERLGELRADVENLQGTMDWVSANPPQNPNSAYWQLAETAKLQYQAATSELARQEQSMEGEGGGEGGGGGGRVNMANVRYPQPQGNLLPAPDPWMQTYVPGLTGAQITRQNVPIPSMQQWAGLTGTQRLKLLGYTDWLGLSQQDIEGQMERMRTRTPAGAGGARWTAARQR